MTMRTGHEGHVRELRSSVGPDVPDTMPGGRLARRLGRELSVRSIAAGSTAAEPVSESDGAGLPPAAQRYVEFMGVVGAPRRQSFLARFEGRFQLRGRWMSAVAWQHNTVSPISRIYVMRLRFAHVLPMIGVDSYVDGKGEMRGKLLGIVPVAEGRGDEFDAGELVTWLNDAVLLAPSFLFDPVVTWAHVDDDSFELTVTDANRSVSATVVVDHRGAPLDFSTMDRHADLPEGLVRAEWTTPIDGWTIHRGRRVPTSAKAVWHLPEGPMVYAEGRFVPESLAYDVLTVTHEEGVSS